MATKQKPINQQVIVITGASSGIGLATAQAAAKAGAKVVLASRDAIDLEKAAADIRSNGGEATAVVTDVGNQEDVARLAAKAIEKYKRVDTWVNNAGVSIYGMLKDVPINDARQLFETNYWGIVYGSLAAIPLLREKGGTLINVGSELSETAIPLQGHYTASKHAVKGFTDALRMELHHEEAPIVVTLIQPAAIDTPYPQHAANYMGVEPKHIDPVYAPQIVADAIIECTQTQHRNLKIGSGAKMFTMIEKTVPGLGDRMKEMIAVSGSKTDEPAADDTNTLYRPKPYDGRVRGKYPGHVMKKSIYTAGALHPLAALAVGAVAAVAVVGIVRSMRD